MVILGLPTSPEILFWSGDKLVVSDVMPLMKGNVNCLILYMIPDDYTIRRYKIKEEELDREMSEFGVIKRTYPKSSIFKLSSNPQNPQWLALCNFDGTMTIDTDIQEALDEVKRMEDMNNTLRDENGRLRQELKERIEYIRELKS